MKIEPLNGVQFLGALASRRRIPVSAFDWPAGCRRSQEVYGLCQSDGKPLKSKQAGESKFSDLLLFSVPQEQPRLSPQFKHL
jgi:hypothetical protein